MSVCVCGGVFLSSFCPKGPETEVPVAVSTPGAQTLASKFHSLLKGTRAFWINDGFQGWGREGRLQMCLECLVGPQRKECSEEEGKGVEGRKRLEGVPTGQTWDK